jgi:NAD(P)H dehydrogenase (quinone)
VAERVAEEIESISGVKALLKSTQEVKKEDFVDSAGVIAGSPVYFGAMAWDLKRVFDEYVVIRRKMENKVGAAFATSGDPSGGKETTIISIIQCLLIYGMIVVGDLMEATGYYGVACVGPPDERTSENARKLGRRVAELCKKLGS